MVYLIVSMSHERVGMGEIVALRLTRDFIRLKQSPEHVNKVMSCHQLKVTWKKQLILGS